MIELSICTRGGQVLRTFLLGDRAEILVGRHATCDVRIAVTSVSEEHCVIEFLDGHVYLRDLGSASGTVVGGARIDRVRITNGLEAAVGPAILRFVETDDLEAA